MEEYARMAEQEMIKQKPKTMSYNNLERASRRFNLY